MEVHYCFLRIDDIPSDLLAKRTKSWGTGQAVLSAKDLVDTPFAVINADDYYGKQAFVKLHDYLVGLSYDNDCCMAGFVLKNTLSENGGATRGECTVDDDGYLTGIVETSNIVKSKIEVEANGVLIDVNSYVSMNMWGFSPVFMEVLKQYFYMFF